MEEKQERRGKLAAMGIKLALSLAALFPVYALVYLTFPASVVGVYVISSVLFAAFAPWDDIRKKFQI